MALINTREAGSKWGLCERRVRELCQTDRVDDAVRVGGRWLVPSGAKRPRRDA